MKKLRDDMLRVLFYRRRLDIFMSIDDELKSHRKIGKIAGMMDNWIFTKTKEYKDLNLVKFERNGREKLISLTNKGSRIKNELISIINLLGFNLINGRIIKDGDKREIRSA